MDGPDPPGLGPEGGEPVEHDRPLANGPSGSEMNNDIAERSLLPLHADTGVDADAYVGGCSSCERYQKDNERLSRLLSVQKRYYEKEMEAKQAAVEGMLSAQQDVKDLIDERTGLQLPEQPAPPTSITGKRQQRKGSGPPKPVDDPSTLSFLPSGLRGSFTEHMKKQAGQQRMQALSSDQVVQVAAFMMQTAAKVLGTRSGFKDMSELKTAFSGSQGANLAADISAVWRLCEEFASGPSSGSGRRPPQAPSRDQESSSSMPPMAPSTNGRATRSNSNAQDEAEARPPVQPVASTVPVPSTRGQERPPSSASTISVPASTRASRAEEEEFVEEEDMDEGEEEDGSTVGRSQLYDEATEEVETARPAARKRKRGGREDQESESEREARERESKRLEKAPLRLVAKQPQAKKLDKKVERDTEKLLNTHKGRVHELVLSEDLRGAIQGLIGVGVKGEPLTEKSVTDMMSRISRFIAQVFVEAVEPLRAIESAHDLRDFFMEHQAIVCRLITMDTSRLAKVQIIKLLPLVSLAFSNDFRRVIDADDKDEEEREAAEQAEKQPTKLKKAMEKRPNMSGSAEMHAMIEGGIPVFHEKKGRKPGGRAKGKGVRARKGRETPEAGEAEEEEEEVEEGVEEEEPVGGEEEAAEQEAGPDKDGDAEGEGEEMEVDQGEEGETEGAAQKGQKKVVGTRRSAQPATVPPPAQRGGAGKTGKKRSPPGRFAPHAFPGSMLEFVLWMDKFDKRSKLSKQWFEVYNDAKRVNKPVMLRAPPVHGKHHDSLNYVQEVRELFRDVAGLPEVPTSIEEVKKVLVKHAQALAEKADAWFRARASNYRGVANSVWAWWYLWEFLFPDRLVPGKFKPPSTAQAVVVKKVTKLEVAQKDEEEGREEGARKSKRKSPTPQASAVDEFDFQEDEDEDEEAAESSVTKSSRLAGVRGNKMRQARAGKNARKRDEGAEDEEEVEDSSEDDDDDDDEEMEDGKPLSPRMMVKKVFGTLKNKYRLTVADYQGDRNDPFVIECLVRAEDFMANYKGIECTPKTIMSYGCKLRRVLKILLETSGSTVEKLLPKMRVSELQAMWERYGDDLQVSSSDRAKHHMRVLFEVAEHLKSKPPGKAGSKKQQSRTIKPASRKKKGGQEAARAQEDVEAEEVDEGGAAKESTKRPAKRTVESQRAQEDVPSGELQQESENGQEEGAAMVTQKLMGQPEEPEKPEEPEEGNGREEDIMDITLDQPDEEDDGTPALELTDAPLDLSTAPPPPPLAPSAPFVDTVQIVNTNAAAMVPLHTFSSSSAHLLGPSIEDTAGSAQILLNPSYQQHAIQAGGYSYATGAPLTYSYTLPQVGVPGATPGPPAPLPQYTVTVPPAGAQTGQPTPTDSRLWQQAGNMYQPSW